MYVMEFLSFGDYLSLIFVNKKFHQIINDHSKYWTRECLRKYFSTDLDSFNEFYESDEYKANLKLKMDSFHKKVWRKYLEEGQKIKITMRTLLRQYTTEEKAEEFVKYFYETFQKPCIPIPKLKRENVICNTKSMFQNKLSEVLYEDQDCRFGNGLFGVDSVKQTIDSLKENESTFVEEILFNEKTDFLKARWYIFEPKEMFEESIDTISSGDKSDVSSEFLGMKRSSDANDETQIMHSSSKPYLLSFYETIYQAISHQCSMIFEYLCSFDNIYDLIAEYTTRWNTYVAAAMEFENIFETYSHLMNQDYEKVFVNYPCFPKFSIWRLMVKIWFKEVFEKTQFSSALHEAFLSILENHREKNVKEALQTNFDDLNLEDLKIGIDMPKSLFLSLNTKFQKKTSATNSSQFNFCNAANAFFTNSTENEKNLLAKYIQSIMDLSLNEVNIHYIDCTDMSTNYPYADLEQSIINESQQFYDENSKHFGDSPHYFCEFLKADAELLSDILNNRTHVKMRKLQIQKELQFLQEFIVKELKTLQVGELPSDCQELSSSKSYGLPQYLEFEDFFQTVCEEKSLDILQCLGADTLKINQKCCTEQIQTMKTLKRVLVAHLEKKHSSLIKHFDILNGKVKSLEEIKQNDLAIREYNASKNIPADLGDMDSFFYDLEKNVDTHMLIKMHEDYVNNINAQSQDTHDKQKELEISKRNRLIPSDDFFNGLREAIMNDEFHNEMIDENIDDELLNLDNLILRRSIH